MQLQDEKQALRKRAGAGADVTLKTRLITAALMIAIMFVLLMCRGVVLFAASLLLTLAAQYELINAFSEKGIVPYRIPSYLSAVLCCCTVFFIGMNAGAAAILVSIFIMVFTGLFSKEHGMDKTIYSTFIAIYPTLCTMCMLELERLSFELLLCGICAAIGSDTFGYFIGHAFGRRKLCPRISPKKTVEGAIGSVFGGVFILVVARWLFGMINFDVTFNIFGGSYNWVMKDIQITWGQVMIGGALGATISIIGDLFASSIKRYCKIKDFSTFLPGHGGILDRLDGVFFSCAAMYLFYFVMSIV